MSSKKDLRTAVRQRKRAMTADDIAFRSEVLRRRVLDTEVYRSAKTLCGYLPFNQEVDLLPLLQQALEEGKLVALPKCYGNVMRFILVTDLSLIQKSTLGAPEPLADEPVLQDPTALVIVPGLVFDRRGYRIGYGGGYYDRFLAEQPNHPTIGLCYDFQLTDRLEPEDHDLPVDTVFFA